MTHYLLYADAKRFNQKLVEATAPRIKPNTLSLHGIYDTNLPHTGIEVHLSDIKGLPYAENDHPGLGMQENEIALYMYNNQEEYNQIREIMEIKPSQVFAIAKDQADSPETLSKTLAECIEQHVDLHEFKIVNSSEVVGIDSLPQPQAAKPPQPGAIKRLILSAQSLFAKPKPQTTEGTKRKPQPAEDIEMQDLSPKKDGQERTP